MRLLLLFVAVPALLGAALPETRFAVTVSSELAADARGRLLLFAEPLTPQNATADEVDTDASDRNGVSLAARDVTNFGPTHIITLDARNTAYPGDFASIATRILSRESRDRMTVEKINALFFNLRIPFDTTANLRTIR